MTNTISKIIRNGTEYEFSANNGGVTSVNTQTGAVTVNDIKVAASAPSTPTEGMAWYDTTNDALKVYDGSNWIETGAVTSVNGATGAVTVSEFTPSNAGSTDQILTKTAGGYERAAAPASGIQNDTTGTTTTVTAIRAGTQAEYNALGSYSSSIIYHIY